MSDLPISDQAKIINDSVEFFKKECLKLMDEAEKATGRRKGVLRKKWKALEKRVEKELEFLGRLENE